ncbi:MAG: cob(I)yrinic acid a,c-diamide adenosyltransferase [Anaerolineales bacterium]|jgi:cob(I)alamin adenosyltransferase
MKKLYTRNGDDGYTGLLGEGRVPKYNLRTETVGTLDEASAVLGIARSTCKSNQISFWVREIQKDLYHIMAEVSATEDNAERFRVIDHDKVIWIEERIDELSEQVSLPNGFILPGDTVSGAYFSLSRTVIRRAERLVARLVHEEKISNREVLRYLNRLSSLCFMFEIIENAA